MSKEKIKVYLYTRVSTAMQIDGYSLDAQKTKMKAFCDYNEYEIAGEYEDAGKSGKSIEGRIAFNQMMDDIKSGKDEVSYVLVFKLSRFGRNAADVLATLQVMQDFGVNLICVEDGIDSSKDAGKLMISVLSAVAEIERENIRVQTMEGRMQKAREGKWNGGFAPYGYSLIDGKLEVNEEEAVAIRMIFDQYVNTDLGANGIAKYLENHGIHKIARQNGKNPLFDAALIRRIIQNPVYSGKISYGRRRTEKVHGTRNEYKYCQRRKTDLENHLYKTYDKIDDAEELLVSAKAKKRSLLADKITGDNIYKALIFFDKLYAQMNEAEKREFLSQLVDNVQIYEERKENGQWLKSIEFKLPIIEKEFTLSLDNDVQNETVVLLSKGAKGPVDLCSARTEVERRMVDSRKVKVDFSLEDITIR